MVLRTPNPTIKTKFKFNDEWLIARDRFNFYLTHDFHPYFAAFPPELVSRLLTYHSKPNDVFLDPFMGGGSAIVEGVINNRQTIGSDISPLSKLVCKVKSTPIKISKNSVPRLFSNIKKSLANRKTVDPAKYDRIRNVEKWFDLDNLTELDSIYNCILNVKEKPFSNFASVAFSSILRKSSNAKNAEQHICIKPNKLKKSPFKLFMTKMELMKQQMDVYYANYHTHSKPKLYTQDVRKLTEKIPENHVDIIITSPPYGTGSKYTNIYKLNYEWFDFEKPKSKQSLELSSQFQLELKKGIQQMYDVLKPNKYCFFVYGDPSTDTGLTKQAIYDAEDIGFEYRGMITCPIKKTMSKHAEKYMQFIPKDFIIILQKRH